MVVNGARINSSDIPSLLKQFFLVKYIIDPNSWNELLKFISPETKEFDLKLMMEAYCREGKFSAFFPEDIKHISEEKMSDLIDDYRDKKVFLNGGYIQVLIENYTDKPYCKAFLKKIGKKDFFFYNNYPYGNELLITDEIETKNRFSIPGNFCKDINGEYHYKEDSIDWDFSNKLETKRLHIKDDLGKERRLKIDTPYKAYMVYAKKEYSKFFIGYNALVQKKSDDILKINKSGKLQDINLIQELLKKDEKLKVNPSFILKFGTDVIEYESAKFEQRYQISKILEKVNRRCGTTYSLDDFSDFLSLLTSNQEIKFKENYETDKVKEIKDQKELIKNIFFIAEKDYAIQVEHNKAIDRVLKTYPENTEPYELDEDKLSQIAKGIFDSEYKLKQELYYEDKALPFTPAQCEYIKTKFNKLINTQLSTEEINALEYRVELPITEFSILAMYNSLHYYIKDSDKSAFYISLSKSELWFEICNAYDNYKITKDKNEKKFKNHELDADSEQELSDDNYDRIDNQEYYEQIAEIQNYIKLIDPTLSDLWKLLNEKLSLLSGIKTEEETFDLRKEFANDLKTEYWNQKHSWESLYNAYKKRCETPLYSMPHFKAILDYVYSKLMGIEKKVSDKPELFQRFKLAIKCKEQIEKDLLENFSGEKEKEFLNLLSRELSFLCKVVEFHDSRIHIDFEVLLNFVRNFAEIGYETYWCLFNDKEKVSIQLKVFYEDRMLSVYENCNSSLGGINNDR